MAAIAFSGCGSGGNSPPANPSSTPAGSTHNPTKSGQPTGEKIKDGRARPTTNILSDALEPIAQMIRDRHLDLARDRLRRHLAKTPADGQAIFLVGLTFHREQKYGQALPHYERALALDPIYVPINHFRGWALYYTGELDLSRAAFNDFLKLKPDEPDSHFALGLIELDEHDLDEAQRYFERSIELWNTREKEPDPRSIAKVHTRLSEVFEQRGELEPARANLQKAVDLFPDHYEALYRLYRVLLRLGETQQAERVHTQYLATKERVRPGTSFPE